MRARTLPALLTIVALVGAACSADGERSVEPDDAGRAGADTTDTTGTSDAGSPAGGAGGAGGAFPQALVRFDDCAAFLDHIRAAARDRVGPYGLELSPVHWFGDDMILEEAVEDTASDDAGSDTAGAAVPASEGGDGDAIVGTNVQEAGVDEPDIVKTDGDRILTVTGNVLTYVDVTGEQPVRRGTLALPDGWGHELFFRADRAFLLTNGGFWDTPLPVEPVVDDLAAETESAVGSPPPGDDVARFDGPVAVIHEVDLSDPADLRIARTLRIQGEYLSARAIGDHVRLAITSPPSRLPWVYPQSEAGEERATETNRAIIEESPVEAWLPAYELSSGGEIEQGQLLACDRIHHPAEFSGFETVSVIDLDLAAGLDTEQSGPNATGVLASGRTVYSSMSRFYVSTTRWAGFDLPADERDQWSEDYATQIHAFSIAPGEPTEYIASGSVAGSLLNQFSLDEHEGYLRVLTTEGDPWGGPQDQSETGLVVLEEQGDRLVEVGAVGGLGRGERLYSARLMGDVGFAVTFRQIDPFYVLDLSDPRNPRVTGELKIPGVSTYLHRVDEHHVLGVGQDATEDGATTGLKLSLFDVSDPAAPAEVSVWTLPNAYSAAEWDHRAFQMIGTTAIVPTEHWQEGWFGAIVFDVGDTITEIGRIEHAADEREPTSDCRPVDADLLTPDASELYWMAADAFGHVQICGPDDVGGWGDWSCDRIPASELQHWFYDDETRDADLAALQIADGDVLEYCWNDAQARRQIQRSLVIGDTLWTMSWNALQANALDDLSLRGSVAIG